MLTVETYSYSITIRPRKEDFDTYLLNMNQEEYQELYGKKYVVSFEKGQGDEYNHIQSVMTTTKSRSDSVRRMIVKYFSKKHLILTNISLKVRSIKTNLEGVIGYCLKEGGKTYCNGYDQSFLSACLDKYNSHADSQSYDKKSIFKINPKNYHIQVENYINNNLSLKQQVYNSSDIKTILAKMAVKGYYLTFINDRNALRIYQYLQAYLNKSEEEFHRIFDAMEADSLSI